MQELRGRVAVVTGAASGIGLAMARRFGEEGMKVVLSDVEEEALASAVKALESEGHRVAGARCDVRFQESVDDLRDAALKEFGAVHVVCNNAGVARAPGGGKMWEYDLNDWNWILSVKKGAEWRKAFKSAFKDSPEAMAMWAGQYYRIND